MAYNLVIDKFGNKHFCDIYYSGVTGLLTFATNKIIVFTKGISCFIL